MNETNIKDFPQTPGGWTMDREFFKPRELLDAPDENFYSKGGLKYLYRLLPKSPVAQGSRLAGLKPPAGSVDESFGSVQ